MIGLYKTEVIRKDGPWKGVDDVEFAALDWLSWFNDQRLLGPIGDIPPAEFEQMYYQLQQSCLVEVGLNQNCLRKTRGGSVFANSPSKLTRSAVSTKRQRWALKSIRRR